jgi:uncharacterized protein with gpF-like domain
MDFLKMKRKEMKPYMRKRNTLKGITWLYPSAVENRYYTKLKNLLNQFIAPTTEFIRENIMKWVRQYQADSYFRTDLYPDDLKIFIEELEDKLQEIYKNQGNEIRTLITDIGFDVSEFNQTQWKKFTKTLIGVEFVMTEPWEIEVIRAWAEDNFVLIKSLTQEYIKKVNVLVSNTVLKGGTSQGLMKQSLFKEIEQNVFRDLKKMNKNMAEYRTRLIARDQVGKLNGQLVQRRMNDAGMDKYIWLTMGDEKVRGNPGGRYRNAIPSHYIMSGKICRWDNPNVYSEDQGKTWKKRTGKMPKAHPGQEIRCRCSALPFIDDIIKEVDKLIAKEEKVA